MPEIYIKDFKCLCLLILCSMVLVHSCGPVSSEAGNDKNTYKRPGNKNLVDVITLKRRQFTREIVSNGKLAALKKSDLTFSTSGVLTKLPLKNGDVVKAGDIIAAVEPFTYQQQLLKAQINFKKTRLERESIITGQGYDMNDSSGIPAGLMETAAIKSGFMEARLALEEARYLLSSTVLKAPFTGIIANLESRKYEDVPTGKPFCTIIDHSKFVVEFYLVESEIAQVRVKDPVKVLPYASQSIYKGLITEINPVIDENGLVRVKAVIHNQNQELLDGMNLKVLVEKTVDDQLVVPKAAVVLRQNQEVIFKYTHGQAFWTYVQTTDENSESFTVIAHPDKGGSLQPEDTVIISGNLNLAHESEVIIDTHD